MEDEKAFAIAGRMGLEGYYTASGDDGTVVFLEDGRMLKLTSGKIETALCLALAELQAAGRTHPAVPRVDGVYAYDDEVDLRPLADAVVPVKCYAIVREAFDDQMEPRVSDQDYALLSWAWVTGNTTYLDSIASGSFGPDMQSVLSGLEWVRDNTGFHLRDVSLSNIGESRSGAVGMRDFGRADVDERRLRRVLDGDLPPAFEEAAFSLAP